MIHYVHKFAVIDAHAELTTIPKRAEVTLVYCKEDAKWYSRVDGNWANVTEMQPRYANIQDIPPGGESGPVEWIDILNKPATFAPDAHNHDYAATTHNHDGSYAPAVHTHDYAATNHNHDAAYAAIAHNHTGTYEPANVNIQSHVTSAHAPSNAQKNSDITKAEIEAKLTGVIASHSHAGGGSDPWTYIRLGSDFVTSSSTAVNVTGLAFEPAINSTYVIEGMFLMRTATATVGPRPGCSWPTSNTDGVVQIDQTSSATARVMANGNMNAAALSPVGGLPNTTQSYPATIWGTLVTGASTSGNFQVQLASETAGTNVTMKAGSWIRYRTVS